jgi:hypothetical protein
VTEKPIILYLSGSIRKGVADRRDLFWDDESISLLKKGLSPRECIVLDPSIRSDDLSDYRGTFGRDLYQVACSDCVLVDARDRRGIGVGAEMLFAKSQLIPVVSIVPEDSHYYRRDFVFMGQHLDEWVHPFVWGLSDMLVSDLAAAVAGILRLTTGKATIKGLEECYASIRHYVEHQLERDYGMKHIVDRHPEIQGRSAALIDQCSKK